MLHQNVWQLWSYRQGSCSNWHTCLIRLVKQFSINQSSKSFMTHFKYYPLNASLYFKTVCKKWAKLFFYIREALLYRMSFKGTLSLLLPEAKKWCAAPLLNWSCKIAGMHCTFAEIMPHAIIKGITYLPWHGSYDQDNMYARQPMPSLVSFTCAIYNTLVSVPVIGFALLVSLFVSCDCCLHIYWTSVIDHGCLNPFFSSITTVQYTRVC